MALPWQNDEIQVAGVGVGLKPSVCSLQPDRPDFIRTNAEWEIGAVTAHVDIRP